MCRFPALTIVQPVSNEDSSGCETVAPLPSPICPRDPAPQQKRLPAVVIPHACSPPAVALAQLGGWVTCTGRDCVWFMPFPRLPKPPEPQHHSSLPLRIPQLKSFPGSTELHGVAGGTLPGTSRLLVVPSPSWPWAFAPQSK